MNRFISAFLSGIAGFVIVPTAIVVFLMLVQWIITGRAAFILTTWEFMFRFAFVSGLISGGIIFLSKLVGEGDAEDQDND